MTFFVLKSLHTVSYTPTLEQKAFNKLASSKIGDYNIALTGTFVLRYAISTLISQVTLLTHASFNAGALSDQRAGYRFSFFRTILCPTRSLSTFRPFFI